MVHSWSAECGHNPFVRRGGRDGDENNQILQKGGHKA